MPGADLRAAGAVIARCVLASPEYATADTVHIYIDALPGEAPTRTLAERVLADGKRVVCPRVASLDPPELETMEFSSMDRLKRSDRGLWEIEDDDATLVDPAAIDLLLIPGVAFDREGHRLGMGGGFYDRFLPVTRAPRLALALSLQVVDSVPHTERDEPVDAILTEVERIDCRRA